MEARVYGECARQLSQRTHTHPGGPRTELDGTQGRAVHGIHRKQAAGDDLIEHINRFGRRPRRLQKCAVLCGRADTNDTTLDPLGRTHKNGAGRTHLHDDVGPFTWPQAGDALNVDRIHIAASNACLKRASRDRDTT